MIAPMIVETTLTNLTNILTGDELQGKKFLTISKDYKLKYSIKPTNDSDKENARQLELIMNNKKAAYDDISEVIKERVDNFEFRKPCIIRGYELLISKTESKIISFDQRVNDEISKKILESGLHKSIESLMEFGIAAEHILYDDIRGICIQSINPMGMYTAVIGGLNHNIIITDDIEIKEPELIKFEEQKQPKENHPHGWYRKFDKKRY